MSWLVVLVLVVVIVGLVVTREVSYGPDIDSRLDHDLSKLLSGVLEARDLRNEDDKLSD